MDNLTKLTEKFEAENPVKKAFTRNFNKYGNEQPPTYTNDFVLWLASRPTCGKEQRLFLDEVEKSSWYSDELVCIGLRTVIHNSDFKSKIIEVIKGE